MCRYGYGPRMRTAPGQSMERAGYNLFSSQVVEMSRNPS